MTTHQMLMVDQVDLEVVLTVILTIIQVVLEMLVDIVHLKEILVVL